MGVGLKRAVADIPAYFFNVPELGCQLEVRWTDVSLKKLPAIDRMASRDALLFWKEGEVSRSTPQYHRENHSTYEAPLSGQLEVRAHPLPEGVPCLLTGDERAKVLKELERSQLTVPLGGFPVMVLSDWCSLRGADADKLRLAREDTREFGGFFIINGLEKLMRMLVATRRNYPMVITRGGWTKRGRDYSELGVLMRCVRPDETSRTVCLHYLKSGNCVLRFLLKKQEFFMPLAMVLRALSGAADREVFHVVMQGDAGDSELAERVEIMLRDHEAAEHPSQDAVLRHLGRAFKGILDLGDEDVSAREAGVRLLRQHVLVHVQSFRDKFQFLAFAYRKLLLCAVGRAKPESTDSPANFEVHQAGHVMLGVLKESLRRYLRVVKIDIGLMLNKRDKSKRQLAFALSSPQRFMKSTLTNVVTKHAAVSQRVHFFLSTGTLIPEFDLDLQQSSGFFTIAERLNYLRFVSHFRALHRGAFFASMRTTAVRKLLPESWGFLCPVHTPDGAPCGLLNHLAAPCFVTTDLEVEEAKAMTAKGKKDKKSKGKKGEEATAAATLSPVEALERLLVAYGMRPLSMLPPPSPAVRELTVLLDGRVVGLVESTAAAALVRRLRVAKVRGDAPRTLEIGFVAPGQRRAMAAVYLWTTPARLMRPVYPLFTSKYLEDGDVDDDDEEDEGDEEEEEDGDDKMDVEDGKEKKKKMKKKEKKKLVEFIGTFEQTFLNVACTPDDVLRAPGRFSHADRDPADILSVVASFTPFCDNNQSPRNMYQAQMGKQTMGIGGMNQLFRTDNKEYLIFSPQRALATTDGHRRYRLDDFPQGANAVVAVISYTGYDMEDAMIINKSSYERGFGMGYIYKNELIELHPLEHFSNPPEEDSANRVRAPHLMAAGEPVKDEKGLGADREHDGWGYSGEDPSRPSLHPADLRCPDLDADGLPLVGKLLVEGSPMYAYYDERTAKHNIVKYKKKEPAYVDKVRVLPEQSKSAQGKPGAADGDDGAPGDGTRLHRAMLRLRIDRRPVVGDKFSSRHGQKGVLGQLWPAIDMPFTESGMQPDIIINPHAFPSRMTIGMLIESMAGKAGALHGRFQDATPFRFNEERRAIDHYGEQLRRAGYQYYGNESMYSGTKGGEMRADIFIGLVYYQRLRHMVSDKYQVRSIGPVNPVTQQPIKGRAKGGGIRLGEMERDSLLSHGCSFFLDDRTMNCSDGHQAYVCRLCGSLLAPLHVNDPSTRSTQASCLFCETGKGITPVRIPFVLRYFVWEMAFLNIRVYFEIKEQI